MAELISGVLLSIKIIEYSPALKMSVTAIFTVDSIPLAVQSTFRLKTVPLTGL